MHRIYNLLEKTGLEFQKWKESLFSREKRDIGISYCRFLLHDTMLRDDSHRTGTADSSLCECGFER